MLQIFIFLLILLQHNEIFCGGKFSKTASSSHAQKTYEKINEYDESFDNINFENQNSRKEEHPKITTQLTSHTIIDKNNATQWTTSKAILNPTEDQILSFCGGAMDSAYKTANDQDDSSLRIAIIVEVNYNPKSP